MATKVGFCCLQVYTIVITTAISTIAIVMSLCWCCFLLIILSFMIRKKLSCSWKDLCVPVFWFFPHVCCPCVVPKQLVSFALMLRNWLELIEALWKLLQGGRPCTLRTERRNHLMPGVVPQAMEGTVFSEASSWYPAFEVVSNYWNILK